MEYQFTTLIIKSLFYFPIIFVIVSSFRFVGFTDPILRLLIWPVGGLVYLIFSPNLFTVDGIYFFLALSWLLFLSFFSTPSFIPPKICTSAKVMFVAKGILVLMLIFSLVDLFINTNLDNSAFNAGTFDNRGNLSFPAIRFLKGAVSTPSLVILLMLRKYSRPFYFKIWVIVFIVSFIPLILSPGKALLVTPLFLALDLIFFNNILEGNFYPSRLLRNLRVRTDRLRELSFLVLPILIILALTIFFIQFILNIGLIDAFTLFLYRLIDASYDLPFDVVESSSVHIGINNPPSEFSNIIELWLKPFSKNLLGTSYVNDTIPKYLEGLLFSGRSTYGISSPNSNLVLEFASIHGAMIGFILFIGITLLGSVLRKKLLKQSYINLQTLICVPIIALGPLFCFQSAQPFFTSYIPYIIIVFSLSFFYDLLLSLNLLKSTCR